MRRVSWAISILVLLSASVAYESAALGQEPNARFTAHANRNSNPLEYIFDARASSDPDGQIVRYAWDFGDESGSMAPQAVHVYGGRGEYTVTLVVIDDSGESATASRTIHVTGRSSATTSGGTYDIEAASGERPRGYQLSFAHLFYGLAAVAAILGLALVSKVIRKGCVGKMRRILSLLKAQRTSTYTREDLNRLSPREFERLIAHVWKKKGFNTSLTGRSADGGIDVIADRAGQRLAIQAKRYAEDNSVGVRSVREYASLRLRPDISDVAVVTSSQFTRSAREEALQMRVELVDGEDLLALLSRYKIDMGMSVSAVRNLRKLRRIVSVCTALASGLLIYIGQRLGSPPAIFTGSVLALLLVLAYTPLLWRLSRRWRFARSVNSASSLSKLDVVLPDTDERLPLFDPPTDSIDLRYHDVQDRSDVLNTYGWPDEKISSSADGDSQEIWRYRIPMMVFQFDTEGRIVSRFRR